MDVAKPAFRALAAVSSISCLSLLLASCGPDPVPVPEGAFVNNRVPEATPGGIPSAAALPQPQDEPYAPPAPVPPPQPERPAAPQTEIQQPQPAQPSESAKKPVPSGVVEYTVQKNDSLWKIASVYGLTVKRLADFNGMEASAILQPGDVILIPPGGRHSDFTPTIQDPDRKPPKIEPKKPAVKPLPPADGKMKVHVVKKGETLGGLAYRNGLRVSELARANGLSVTAKLKIGQRLNIPESKAKGSDKKSSDKKTVSPEKKKSADKKPAKTQEKQKSEKPEAASVKQPANERPAAPEKEQTANESKSAAEEQNAPAATAAQPAQPAQPAAESAEPVAETAVVAEQTETVEETADELPNSVPISLDMEMSLEEIAVEYDRDLPTIQRLNPGIDAKKKLPARTMVKIPVSF